LTTKTNGRPNLATAGKTLPDLTTERKGEGEKGFDCLAYRGEQVGETERRINPTTSSIE
jgi:hypothetical protein